MTAMRRTVIVMSEQRAPHEAAATSNIPAWTLGWRLQRALAHAGLNVDAMVDELGISRSTASRWMNDHGAAPKAAYVKQWALRCGVPYQWLSDGTEPTNGPDDHGSPVTPWFKPNVTELATRRRHVVPAETAA